MLETTPLVGSLGRACYAPCEERVHARQPRGAAADPAASSASSPTPTTRSASDAGSRPRAERQARRGRRLRPGRPDRRLAARAARGYGVTIFEAAPVAGGALRLAIPGYRLPAEVVERDVANVTDARRRDPHGHADRRPRTS